MESTTGKFKIKSKYRGVRKTSKEAVVFALEMGAVQKMSQGHKFATVKQMKARSSGTRRNCFLCNADDHIKPDCVKWKTTRVERENGQLTPGPTRRVHELRMSKMHASGDDIYVLGRNPSIGCNI